MMDKTKKNRLFVCIAVIVCCAVMALVDGVIRPPYAVKSAVKIALFLAFPLGFAYLNKLKPLELLKPEKKSVLLGFLLGGGTFAVVLTAYFVLSPYIDLSAVPSSLAKNAGVTKDNYTLVFTYIALCNSLLEEFFFRGFAFLTLKKVAGTRFAMVFSAAAFAVYHAAMLDGWMDPILTALLLAALFGCGIFFNFLDMKKERIWTSYITHGFANLAINTIGAILLNAN